MKVVIKTLRNVKHELDVSSGDTVADLKKKIEAMKLADVDAQKLLHKGRILRDSQLATETFAENDTIILMKTRKKKAKKVEATEPEPADENSPQSANTPTARFRPSARDLNAAGVYKAIKEQQDRARAEAMTQQAEAMIETLVSRGQGIDKASAAQALALAKGDVEKAYSYLTEGIPAEVAAQWAQSHGGVLSKEQEDAVKRNVELQKIRAQQIAEAKQREAEIIASLPQGTQGMTPQMAQMMANPQMLQSVLGNPMVQQQIQGIMAQEMPELFASFQADPDGVGETEEFQKAVFSILSQTMTARPLQPRGRPNVIRLTKEESDGITAVNNDFGGQFPRQALLQAYMGCGRDLDQLRDFLRQRVAESAENQQASSNSAPPSSSGPNPADDCDPE